MELSSEGWWYDCELGIKGGRFLWPWAECP